MDRGTIIGVISGLFIIGMAVVEGGGWEVFIDIPALQIMGGGIVCSSMIHFSLSQFLGVFGVVKKTIVKKLTPPQELIKQMVNYAVINRREGALALEQEMKKVKDPFVIKGLQMLVDGQQPDSIRETLNMEIQYLRERHAGGKKILEWMGSCGPAFGMVATLIALVKMLGSMEDPSKIGESMAVALVATFYGALSANLIFLPLAGKLGMYSKEETLLMEMLVEGVCSIAKGENPTVVREKMQLFISPKIREQVKAVA
jgi:chemotaxis protein MotA